MERFDSELLKILDEHRLKIAADNALLSVYSPDYRGRVIISSSKQTVTDTEVMSTDEPGWHEIFEYLEDGDSYYFETDQLESGNLRTTLLEGGIEAAIVSPVLDISSNQLIGYVGYSWVKGSRPSSGIATLYSEKSAAEIDRLIQFL